MDLDIPFDETLASCGYQDTAKLKRNKAKCSRCCVLLPADTGSSLHGRHGGRRARPPCRSCAPASSQSHRYLTPEEQEDFACYGELKSGGRWGCGRHFSRLKDFAQHLRTRTGRKCIQPLYDEEKEMRQQWAGPPNRQKSTGSSPSESLMALETATGDVYPLAQLEQCPADFVFSSYGSDCDTDGSPQMDMAMPVDQLFLSPYLLDSGVGMRDATIPGASYMVWWQSYMSSISVLDHPGGLGLDA